MMACEKVRMDTCNIRGQDWDMEVGGVGRTEREGEGKGKGEDKMMEQDS